MGKFYTFFMKHYKLFPFYFPVCCCFQRPSGKEQEHLQVFLRIRPFTAAERVSGECQVRTQ